MSFALVVEILETRRYFISCAACRKEAGSMDGDTIRSAVLARGPIICPDCREKHCDWCGVITSFDLPFLGHTLWRACIKCQNSEAIKEDPPNTKFVLLAGLGAATPYSTMVERKDADEDYKILDFREDILQKIEVPF